MQMQTTTTCLRAGSNKVRPQLINSSDAFTASACAIVCYCIMCQGDSTQNIVGDLVSATLGWYVTALLHLAGCPWLVIVWTAVSEAVLVCAVQHSTGVQYR